MRPDETLEQPDGRQVDSAPPPPHLTAGECGDPIWEGSACQGGTVDGSRRQGNDSAQPGGREVGFRGGRFIDLVERRPRRKQAEG